MPTKTQATTDVLLTVRDAAEYLRLHVDTVRHLVRAEALPASRVGRAIRFQRSVLDAHIAANPVKPKRKK